jgi:uncharacterized membrane protein HdeD (DUF308 family)
MSTGDAGVDSVRTAVRKTIRDHWVVFLVEGIALLLLGLLAIILPVIATLAIEQVIGWVLLASGIIGLYMTWRVRGAAGTGWSWLSAAVGILAGVLLLRWPLSGAVSLTLIVSAFLLIEGFATIMFASGHRREASGRWRWMLMSGIVDVVLAGILLFGLPGTAAWAVGLLVGINMLFGGWALIGMAMHGRAAALGADPPKDPRNMSSNAVSPRI